MEHSKQNRMDKDGKPTGHVDVAHGTFYSLSIAQLRTEIMKNNLDVTWE